MFWLSFPFRRLVTDWDNSRPKGEVLPPHYRQVVGWAGRHPECGEGDLCLDHRGLYCVLVAKRGPVGVYGVGPAGWAFVNHRGLSNRERDLNWLCVLRRLPVREVLHRHGLSRLRDCPRVECGALGETVSHIFVECPFPGWRGWGFPRRAAGALCPPKCRRGAPPPPRAEATGGARCP